MRSPRVLADFLAEWAIQKPSDRVLDPGCGEAVFLAAAVDRLRSLGAELSHDQVVGYELDAESAAEAARLVPEATVKPPANFFDQEPAGVSYEAVIGKPPWIRYHFFSGEIRDQALATASREGVTLTRLTSSWAPFVVHATRFLAPGGRLAFVLPAELLTTDYAASIRLARRFADVLVLTFEERHLSGRPGRHGARARRGQRTRQGAGSASSGCGRTAHAQRRLAVSYRRSKVDPCADKARSRPGAHRRQRAAATAGRRRHGGYRPRDRSQ